MTHPTYTQQALRRYNLPRLKRIAAELGVTPTGDKRGAQTWVNAILTHQSAQPQKFISPASIPLTPIEISFYDHEYYAGDKLIAAISYDDDLTQPWVVMVNNKEVHRTATVMLCHRYISTHYKDGSLPVQEQNATETPCTTGNEIMAEIFNECEKYGFEILDDGIYHNEVKLGEVGYRDGGWWVTRAVGGNTERVPCQSALVAVCLLAMPTAASYAQAPRHAKTALCEQLLDRPFEMLTNQEWEQLREYEALTQNRELVTA